MLSRAGEKWFHAVRAIANGKSLSFIGFELVGYCAHHNNYIGKETRTAVTTFVLNSNGIVGGGVTDPIACARFGKMTEAKKDI